MSGRDKNVKKIHAADIRKNCDIRAEYSSKEKPNEKAAEHFRRKAYQYEPHKKTNADGKEKGHEQC